MLHRLATSIPCDRHMHQYGREADTALLMQPPPSPPCTRPVRDSQCITSPSMMTAAQASACSETRGWYGTFRVPQLANFRLTRPWGELADFEGERRRLLNRRWLPHGKDGTTGKHKPPGWHTRPTEYRGRVAGELANSGEERQGVNAWLTGYPTPMPLCATPRSTHRRPNVAPQGSVGANERQPTGEKGCFVVAAGRVAVPSYLLSVSMSTVHP